MAHEPEPTGVIVVFEHVRHWVAHRFAAVAGL